MKIEIILLGIIGIIILLDFTLKRSKKKKGVDEIVKVDVAKKQQIPKSNLNRLLFVFITSLISSAILTYTIDSLYFGRFAPLEGYIDRIKFDPLPHIANFTILFIVSFILFWIVIASPKRLQFLLDRKKSIGLIIFSTIISKPLVTYIFFTKKIKSFSSKEETLNWHFTKIFEYENIAFLISFLFVLSAFYFLKDSRLSFKQNRPSSRIRKLEKLYKDGVVTEQEFKSKKEEIRKDLLNDI